MNGLQSLEQRYGAPSRARRVTAIAAIALLALGFLAFWVWAAVAHQGPPYGAALSSYHVVSKYRVRALVAVHRAAGIPMVCTVTAQAVDHALVGENRIRVPAGPERDFTVPVSIRTDRRATSATVRGCR